MSGSDLADGWRLRAEDKRRNQSQDRLERSRRAALRRLRRREQAALARLAEGSPIDSRIVIFDSARYAAPLHERLGPRERVQILLWASMLIVFGLALVSFFSAPLMDYSLAVSALLVGTMLILSYIV